MGRKDLKEPSCAVCSLPFHLKDPSYPVGSKCPLLLKCGHTACEGCIRYNIRGKYEIKCNICEKVSDASKLRPTGDLRGEFPINTLTIGQIALKNGRSGKEKIGDSVIGFQKKKKEVVTSNTFLCCECRKKQADCLCRQCAYKFCTPCFSKVHSAAIVLQKHEKIPLDSSENIASCEEVICKIHPGNLFMFYCNQCLVYCCKECCCESHIRHNCMNVNEKNQEVLEEFSQAYNEASFVLKQLHITKKKVETSVTETLDDEVSQVEKQVIQHFNQIHGLLILEEEEILKKIGKSANETHCSLSNVANDLETNIKEMDSILTQCKYATEGNNLRTVPLFPLFEKLKRLTQTPCHLILNDEKENLKFEFTVNKNVFDNLKDHCSVLVPIKREYELRSTFDLPDEYEVEEISAMPDPIIKPDVYHEPLKQNDLNRSTCQNSKELTPVLPQAERKTKPTSYQDVLRKNKQSLSMSKADDNLSTISTTSSTESAVKFINTVPVLTEGSTDVVTICHLINPSDFYVQRKSCQSQLEKLRDHFSRKSNIKTKQPTSVEIGQMYLVEFSRDKNWYRAVVKQVIDSNKFIVFYVDYGNSDEVSASQLREISEEYIKIPEQAIHCSLYGCVPIDGQWKENAPGYMVTMTLNMELSMVVERVSPSSSLYEVRLRRVNDNSNITDALIFLNFAVATESTDRDGGIFKQTLPLNKKYFFKESTVKAKDTFDAQITHINTPSNFYIQRFDDGGKLAFKLMKELEMKYSHVGTNELLVFNPAVGMAVAAKFKDGTWYRGVIRDIPKPLQVQVQFVDFGNVENVTWENIRVLSPLFLRTGVLGLRCSLSDVAPKNPKGWTAASKKAFENMSQSSVIRVYIDEVNESCLSVTMYQTQNDKDICINGLLVKKGYATSVGPSSAEAEFSRGHIKQVEDSSSTTSSGTKNQIDSLVNTKKSMNLLGKSSEIMSSSSISSVSSQNVRTSEENDREDEGARVKIMVMKLASPDEIHIAFENVNKQIFGLIEEMTQYYNAQTVAKEVNKKWQVSDICAVFRKSDKKWYRGVLVSIEKNRFKVFIKDIVDVVEAEATSLRVLEIQFTRIMDGSFKCHLCGILPPGGGVKWPVSTEEYLEALLATNTDYYIEKMGQSVNDSLPVKLWVKKIKMDGPLSPVEEDWDDVTSLLLRSGLALPDRSSEYFKGFQKNPEDSNNDSQSDCVSSVMVSQWLQNSYEVYDDQFLSSNQGKKNIQSISNSFGNLREISVVDNRELDWLPAEPFIEQEFIAISSYVDMDCAIYIQDKERSKEVLNFIQKSLLLLFQGTCPKPHDLTWSKGQICIAYYETDKNWYRGKVIDVKPDCIEVLFVDYGNTESLQPDQLRKKICMGDIPIQCHRCLSTGIIPLSKNGKWATPVLDYVHALTVDFESRVKLKPPTPTCNNYVILELILPCGQSLLDVLASMNYATYKIDCNEVGSRDGEGMNTTSKSRNGHEEHQWGCGNLLTYKSKEDDNTFIATDSLIQHQPESLQMKVPKYSEVKLNNLGYKGLILPDSLVELEVEVPVVLGPTLVRVNILKCDDTEIMSMKSDFELMQEQIQEKAEEMPLVLSPILGAPCLGCFTLDDVWYRGLIKEVLTAENLVLVLYVDYGNAEMLPLERLREIKEDWMKIPIQSIEVTLYDITEGPNHDAKSNTELMSHLESPPYTMTIEVKLNNLGYKGLILPDSLVELEVEVPVVLGPTLVRVNILKCDDTEIMSMKSDFELMQEQIQEKAEEMPLVLSPILGAPCLGCFTLDDVWYRGLIKEVLTAENLVLVLYVDYGNAEMLPLERLREIKEDWMKIPIQSIEVTLYDITEGPNHDAKSNTELMSHLESPPYTMTIEARQPNLEVEFYNSDGELAYQTLLDKGILSKLS